MNEETKSIANAFARYHLELVENNINTPMIANWLRIKLLTNGDEVFDYFINNIYNKKTNRDE